MMSFILGPAVQKSNVEVPIRSGDSEFVLILRPVTDDERLFDQGLRDRFWNSDDPEIIGGCHVARAKMLLKLVVGWSGIVDPAGKPVAFTREAFGILLTHADAAKLIGEALLDHFLSDGGAGRREKGESAKSDDLPQGSSAGIGSTPTTSLSKSSGIPDGSQQVDLPQGSTSIIQSLSDGMPGSSTS